MAKIEAYLSPYYIVTISELSACARKHQEEAWVIQVLKKVEYVPFFNTLSIKKYGPITLART